MGRRHAVMHLKCFGVDVVLEKKMRRKEKRKVKIRGKLQTSEDKKKKRKVKIETRERCEGGKKRKEKKGTCG